MIITVFTDNCSGLGQKSQVVKNSDFRSIRHPAEIFRIDRTHELSILTES